MLNIFKVNSRTPAVDFMELYLNLSKIQIFAHASKVRATLLSSDFKNKTISV